jgi:hypothetical protein
MCQAVNFFCRQDMESPATRKNPTYFAPWFDKLAWIAISN